MKKNIIYILLIFVCVFCLFLVFNRTSYSEKQVTNNDLEKTYEKENDLFFDYYDEAEELMKDMSIADKISQLFIIRYDSPLYGADPSYIGGFILYGSFFKDRTPKRVNRYVSNLQNEAKIKYAIAVDEEGGTVSRISAYKQFRNSKFLSPNKLYKKGGIDLLLETEDEKDELLKSLQINLNLAPVADVSTDKDDFMNDRTIGKDAITTASYISAVTKIAKENGISTCLKHFPGYGNNGDTHYGSIVDKRKLSYLEENDFLPFKGGIDAGTPFIMVSHNILEDVDSIYPTSLSKKVIDILKNDLEYSGIIMSDDISMTALDSFNADNKAAILAINAGVDMIMSSDYSLHYSQLLSAYKKGEITKERVEYSAKKIIAWKIAYGIIENK